MDRGARTKGAGGPPPTPLGLRQLQVIRVTRDRGGGGSAHASLGRFVFCAMLVRERPSQTWGSLCCWIVRSARPWLGIGEFALERRIDNGGPDLQHEVGAPWRPTHLLPRGHPAVDQALNRAFGDGGRDWLGRASSRCVVDDRCSAAIWIAARKRPAGQPSLSA
jgi:hypothetical protein